MPKREVCPPSLRPFPDPWHVTIWTFNDINSPTQLTIIIHICESTPPPTDTHIIFIIECILSFLERSQLYIWERWELSYSLDLHDVENGMLVLQWVDLHQPPPGTKYLPAPVEGQRIFFKLVIWVSEYTTSIKQQNYGSFVNTLYCLLTHWISV